MGSDREQKSTKHATLLVASTDDDPLTPHNAPAGKLSNSNIGRKRLLHAGIVILVLMMLSGLAILSLGSPSQRYVHLSAQMPQYVLPQPFEIQMSEPKELHISGSKVKLTQIATLIATDGIEKKTLTDQREISLSQRPGASQSSIHALPGSGQGPLKLVLAKCTIVHAEQTQHGELSVVFQAVPPGTIDISFEAEQLKIAEADRVILEPPLMPTDRNSLEINASNHTQMVHLTCRCSDTVEIALASTAKFSLSDGGQSLASSDGTLIKLEDSTISEASFHGAKDTELALYFPSSIELEPVGVFRWNLVETATAGSREPIQIKVSGQGTVKSFRQDGREVL